MEILVKMQVFLEIMTLNNYQLLVCNGKLTDQLVESKNVRELERILTEGTTGLQ